MASVAFDDQLTDEARDAILAAVRSGGYLATACREHRVSYQALKYWRRRTARRPKAVPKRIAEFIAQVDQVHAAIEADLAEKVRGRRRGWRAAAWQLERRFPTRWKAGSRGVDQGTPHHNPGPGPQVARLEGAAGPT